MFLLKSTRSLGGSRFMQRLYKSRNINDKIIFFVKKNFTSHNRYHKTQQTKFTHIGKIQFNLKIPK